MSADNGIYIGHFADGEIRVIHAQAIENLWYPDSENAQHIVEYFRYAPSFDNIAEAREKAFEIEKDISSDEFYPILEYGIQTLTFTKSFEDYYREAEECINPEQS